jgi:hypothetical protein
MQHKASTMGAKVRIVGAERWTQRQGERRTPEGRERDKKGERRHGPMGRVVGRVGEGPTLLGLGSGLSRRRRTDMSVRHVRPIRLLFVR